MTRVSVQSAAESALAESLALVESAFQPNELAYLALTSKAELPIRDRLAWLLHRALGDPFVISREWRRADLAVVHEDAAILQVEAKVLYAFDVLSHANRLKYMGKLVADGTKMAALAPDSSAFLLGLITQVHGEVPMRLRSTSSSTAVESFRP